MLRMETWTLSPGLSTSEGCLTRLQEISERWTRPSAPPISTKAPKSHTELTVPVRTSPSLSRESSSSFLRLAGLLDGLALGEDQAVAVTVDLDHLELEIGVHHARHIRLLLGLGAAADPVHLRGGHKAADSVEVDEQAALVIVDHAGRDHIALLEGRLKDAPALLLPGLIDREDRPTFFIFGLHDKDQQLATDVECRAILSWQRLHLPRGNNTLGLSPDIDQDLVLIDPHDRAVHRIAVLEVAIVVGGVVQELLHERQFLFVVDHDVVLRLWQVLCVWAGSNALTFFHARPS